MRGAFASRSAGIVAATLASLALHLGVLYGLGTLQLDLDLDFELALPAEIEFGVTGAMERAAAPESAPPPAPAPEPPPSEAGTAGEGPGAPVVDAGVPEAVADASVPQVDAGVPAPTPVVDAGPPLVAAEGEGDVDLPPGAQLAMRLDMRKIAGSPLAPAVREFFRSVPDWYYLLDGSGIDPINDLDRLYLATPDPRRRAQLIIAGRVREGAQMRAAVASMATARSEAAPWRRAGGLEVAPWHDLDSTERVMALLGPKQFAITRPEDLPTILAMIRHREEHGREEGLEPARGADALVSMGAEDALSLEVEGIHRYAQGQLANLPERGRVSIGESESGRVKVNGLAFFESEEAATTAKTYWDRVLAQFASRPMLRIIGLASVIEDASLEVEGSRVRIRTELSQSQTRQILAFLGAQITSMTGFVPPAEAPANSAPADSAPAGDPAAPPAPAGAPSAPTAP